MKKKDKKATHAYDTWPPIESKDKDKDDEEKKKLDRLKPRNVSYVDPEEFLNDVPEPVFDPDEAKDETHTDEEDDKEDKDDEKDEDERDHDK